MKTSENLFEPVLEIMAVSNRVKCYFTREDNSIIEIERELRKCNQTNHSDQEATEDNEQDIHDENITEMIINTNSMLKNNNDNLVNDKKETIYNMPIAYKDTADTEPTNVLRSVVSMEIKDESTIAGPVHTVATENDIDVVPVVEFIDIGKKGVKKEKLVIKKRRRGKEGEAFKR